MDGGAWWATVHGVAKSWTRLRDSAHMADRPPSHLDYQAHQGAGCSFSPGLQAVIQEEQEGGKCELHGQVTTGSPRDTESLVSKGRGSAEVPTLNLGLGPFGEVNPSVLKVRGWHGRLAGWRLPSLEGHPQVPPALATQPAAPSRRCRRPGHGPPAFRAFSTQ